MREYLSNTTLTQRLIILSVGVINLILVVRFLLLLFPRIPNDFYSPFYLISNLLANPFRSIAGHQLHNIEGYTFAHIVDKASLIAIVVYTLIGFTALKLLSRNQSKN